MKAQPLLQPPLLTSIAKCCQFLQSQAMGNGKFDGCCTRYYSNTSSWSSVRDEWEASVFNCGWVTFALTPPFWPEDKTAEWMNPHHGLYLAQKPYI